MWHTAGGDRTRKGWLGQEVHPKSTSRLAASGAVQAAPVFDEAGRVFIADLAGGVQCHSPGGRRRWRIRLDGPVVASPAVHPHEPRLFVATLAGTIFNLDALTGATVWRREIPTGSDPRILSDLLVLPRSQRVVLSSWGGRFLALETTTGAERHGWDAGISPAAAATADESENVYCVRVVMERGTELVRVEGAMESVLHTTPPGERGARRMLAAAAPVLDETRRRLYAVTNPGRAAMVVAWDLGSRSLAWTCALPSPVQATPAIDDEGRIFVPDLAGNVLVVTPQGNVQRRIELGCDYLLAGGAGAGARFYLGDPWGRIQALDAAGGVQTLFETPRSVQGRPGFGPDQALYVPCGDHGVYRLANTRPRG